MVTNYTSSGTQDLTVKIPSPKETLKCYPQQAAGSVIYVKGKDFCSANSILELLTIVDFPFSK